MAVGPTLGTGLFIGSGQALAVGGPASLLCSYVFISVLIYCLTTATAEIAAHMPAHNGTMLSHTYRFASTHLGFSLGYLRWYSMALLVPFEITNAMAALSLWEPGALVAVRVGIVAAIILGFNMLPETIFKRMETFFTGVKLVTAIGLILLSTILAARGIPGTPVRGFYYWRHPGAMNQYLTPGHLGRFLGLVQCVLYSTISFIFSPELTVVRAEKADGETGSSVLKVAQIDNIHLCALYILSALAMGVVSPSDEPLLTNYGTGAGLSPYVVGIRRARIPVLPVFATTLIFLSSMASARSFLFVSSRTLCSLAEAGHAPALFKDRNRWGVPYVSVIVSSFFTGLAYLCLRLSVSVVFNFLMYFITTSGYISWLCSCILYLRFRRTTKAQGFVRVHQTFVQPYGAYFAILVCTVLFLANLLMTVIPSKDALRDPIAVYLGILTFLLLYIGHSAKYPFSRIADSEAGEQCSETIEIPHPRVPPL